jgi:HEAT repeat protein
MFFFKPNVEKMEKKRNVEGLIKALEHKDPNVRKAAAKALGRIGDKRAVEPLIKALSDSDWEVRAAAAKALGKLGDLRAVEPLITALKDETIAVRECAAEALGKIGDSRAVEPLISALKDEFWAVRKAAVDALAKIGDARAFEPLSSLCRKERDGEVSAAIWTALREIDAPVDVLLAGLKNELSLIREYCVKKLAETGDPKAVEPLISMLRDETSSVRKAAARALDKLGWKPGQDENSAWYWIARGDWDKCVALGDVAVEPLIFALGSEEADEREGAARALGNIGDPRAAKHLFYLAKNWGGVTHVRRDGGVMRSYFSGGAYIAALEALLKIPHNDMEVLVNLLIDGLSGPLDTRRAVARMLVDLYQSHRIPQQLKEKILALRNVITAPHNDWGTECIPHHDEGIGVDFPL